MPPVNGSNWRNCRVEMDLTSDQAAGLLRIAGAALRQIELELKPASDRLIARASRLYRIPKEALMADKPKEEPAKAPQPAPKVEPTRPAPRRERTTSPKRAEGSAA